MAKVKAKLTNIKPREVSLVDQGANLEDFYVTKKQEGGDMSKKSEKPILKKMAVAIHKVNFFKSQYATKEACIAKMAEDGLEGAESFPMTENDWEYQFEVNSSSLFEGTSLGMYNYVTLNQGVDSLIGVLKGLTNTQEVEKKGAKISSSRMKKLQTISDSIADLIKELGNEPDEDGEPVVKDNNTETKESEVETKVKKSEEEKPEEAKPEEAPTEEAKPEEAPTEEAKPEEAPAEESEVEKRLAAIEKKQDDEIGGLKKENEELKKRLEDLEGTPVESKGAEVETTEEVKKNQGGFWKGVL